MKENPLADKAYNKAATSRMKIRHRLFEKNRENNEENQRKYLQTYDAETRQTILKSIIGPQPVCLLPVAQAGRSTISYYRRKKIFVYKIRLAQDQPIDLHMAYQSLAMLVNLEDLSTLPQHQCKKLQSAFQSDLPLLLSLQNQQIKQLAIAASGNHALGHTKQILNLTKQQKNKWVLVNHVLMGKLQCKLLLDQLNNNNVVVYRCVAELSNRHKHQIVYYIISGQQYVTPVFQNLLSSNADLQEYSMQIIGNILAQAQNYAADLAKWNILQKLFALISHTSSQIRRKGCWLLANYTAQPAAAKQVMHRLQTLQKILIMYHNETQPNIRQQLYIILVHLFQSGAQVQLYKLAYNQSILPQCSYDLQLQQQNQLTLQVLYLVMLILDLGQEFQTNNNNQNNNNSQYQQLQQQLQINNIQDGNPFLYYVSNNIDGIKSKIMGKCYHQNGDISQIASQIIQKVQNQSGSSYF